jgi:hypothetical protein
MHIHSVADRLRAILPRPIWEICRKSANAVLGPLLFSLETGHLRSALVSRALDRHGEPLPWYTYPAIQFLLPKDFSEKRVLEWGAGQSTLFWARRAKQVVAFESDRVWWQRLIENRPGNAQIHLVDGDAAGAETLLGASLFDVIVVDGLDRWSCAQRSLNLMEAGGAIIVDDAERNSGPTAGCGWNDAYRQAGLSRMDFYGFSPGNAVQHCTSIFFRNSCFLLRGDENPFVTLSFWSGAVCAHKSAIASAQGS